MKKADMFDAYINFLRGCEASAMISKLDDGYEKAIEKGYGFTVAFMIYNEKYTQTIAEIWDAWRTKMINRCEGCFIWSAK